MARSRNIKPGIFDNELLGEADLAYTVLFIGLWTLADREGRLEDRPKRIKAKIFPYREYPEISRALDTLMGMGFIDRYSVDGVAVIQIVNFAKHQNPHRNEKPSELPEKPVGNGFQSNSSNVPIKSEQGSPNSEAHGLIPDSFNLIPDSRNLIPDPLSATDVADDLPINAGGWLDWLVDRHGYVKHRNCSTSNMALLKNWCQSKYTEFEVQMAIQLSQERTGKPDPAISYISQVLLSNRQVKNKTATKPENRAGYESPADRAARMSAEDQKRAEAVTHGR